MFTAQVQGDSSISFDLESMLREEEGEYGDLHSFILNETGEMGEEEDESFEADVFVTDAAVVVSQLLIFCSTNKT